MHLRCMTLFGLCAQDYFSRTGHELLDWLGFLFDPADAINFLWYTVEGNAAMAAATAVAIVPAAGSFIAKGTKQAIKAGKKAAQKAGEKAVRNATEKAAKKAAVKKLAKEATETGAEKAAKEAAEKATEKTAKEATEKSAERTAREAVEKGAKGGSSSNTGVGNPVKVEGRGSTGRTIPNNLGEQMAMHQVRSDPLEGATELPIKLNDTRWKSSDGWVKMQSVVETADGNKITIHYVYNKVTGTFDDFKFK